jgi:hypothetical protein
MIRQEIERSARTKGPVGEALSGYDVVVLPHEAFVFFLTIFRLGFNLAIEYVRLVGSGKGKVYVVASTNTKQALVVRPVIVNFH